MVPKDEDTNTLVTLWSHKNSLPDYLTKNKVNIRNEMECEVLIKPEGRHVNK